MQHAAAFGVLHYLKTKVRALCEYMRKGESKTVAWNDVGSNLMIQSCRVSLSVVLNQRCHSETVK